MNAPDPIAAELKIWRLWAGAHCPEAMRNASDSEKRAYMEKAHASQTQTIHQFINMVHELEADNARLAEIADKWITQYYETSEGFDPEEAEEYKADRAAIDAARQNNP